MPSPEMQENFAPANGVRLHYVSAGSGPLILFLHGFPEFWYAWKNQLAEFAHDHLAVAPDMRGVNESEKPRELDAYRIGELVADVRALANHFSPGARFVLVGHDWGGAVAWAFAMAHPEMLHKLIIVNAPHPGIFARLLASDPAQQQASQYMLMFRSGGNQAEKMLSENNYAVLVKIVLGAGLESGIFTEEDKAAYIRAWSQPGALTGGLNYYRANHIGPPGPDSPASGNFALDPAALTVNAPTLVIWGEKDIALLPQNLDGLEKFVPDLTIRRIPDATHWVVHEKSVEVNGYIREFLQRS